MIPFHVTAKQAISLRGALHHPAELAALLGIMHDREVQTVLEIGTFDGGSAWAWLQVPSVTRVVTIDSEPRPAAISLAEELRTWVTLIAGDSTDTATAERAVAALGPAAPPDMVFIDGAHDYPTVRADWELYGPLARPGGMIVFHDISGSLYLPRVADWGPAQVWSEVRPGHDSLEICSIRGSLFGTGIIWADTPL